MKTLVFIFLGLIFSFSLVFAQEVESPAPTGRPGYRIAPEIRQIQKKAKEGLDNLRKERVSPLRVQETKQKTREETEAKRTQLKERLQSVKDEQKKKIVERISHQIDELNARTTNHFSAVLDRLGKVLANIVSRVDKAEANKWDVSAVRIMIKSAEEAITSARKAIEAQKAKTYTPEITGGEEKLKVEVGEARKALHSDLVIVKEKVKAAYEFVKAIAKALAQSPRINELNLLQKDE
ncbi:MAG: hypothetical protein AAB584_01870 [Patescibacteria group bacterium]